MTALTAITSDGIKNAIGAGDFVGRDGLADYLAAALANIAGNQANIANLTDSTTGAAGATLAAGAGVQTFFFSHTFIGGTSAIDSLTNWTPGFKFKILSWQAATDVLLVGGGGSRVLNMEINTTDVGTTPSTLTVAIANAAVGVVTAGTAVAGANTGSATDTISIEVQNGGTAFSAGKINIGITVQNMDTADAIASITAKLSAINTMLQTAGIEAAP